VLRWTCTGGDSAYLICSCSQLLFDLLLRNISRCRLLGLSQESVAIKLPLMRQPIPPPRAEWKVNQYPALLAEIQPARPNLRLQI